MIDIEELKRQLIIASFDFPVEEIGLVERDGMLVPLNFCVHAFDAIESLQRELEEVEQAYASQSAALAEAGNAARKAERDLEEARRIAKQPNNSASNPSWMFDPARQQTE